MPSAQQQHDQLAEHHADVVVPIGPGTA